MNSDSNSSTNDIEVLMLNSDIDESERQEDSGDLFSHDEVKEMAIQWTK